MQTKKIEIINKLGMHARAATKLAGIAGHYSSNIKISLDNKAIDAKSIMSLMLLAACKGTVIKVTTEGPDEVEAMSAVETLINNRFDEGE